MEININKYLGTWYEIARIPFIYERNLTDVKAEYKLIDEDTIEVINSGFYDNQYVKAKGIAKTTPLDDLLMVSFDNKTYSDYKILAVDIGINCNLPECMWRYEHAIVGGSSPDYLWILSRTPKISKTLYDRFIEIAKKNGYNSEKLIITKYADTERTA